MTWGAFSWGAVWRVVSSRAGVALAALGCGLLLAGECSTHREARRTATAPVVLKDTPQAAKMATETLSCQTVKVLRPTPKEARRIEERFGPILGEIVAPEPTGDSGRAFEGHELEPRILALKTVPKAPYGGEALVTLQPSGQTDVTFRANPRPFVEVRGVYGLGGLGGLDSEGRRWRAYGFAEPLRVGRFHLRGEGGVEGRGDGSSGWYALAGAELRLR